MAKGVEIVRADALRLAPEASQPMIRRLSGSSIKTDPSMPDSVMSVS
jgi:hypothetical protein